MAYKKSGDAKRGRGRPPYVPTEENQKQVFLWAKYGVPVPDMARMINLSEMTINKHFADVIEAGRSHAHTKVRETLWEMATSGEHPAMTIFYCKTRLGFREVDRETVSNGQITLHVKGGLPD